MKSTNHFYENVTVYVLKKTIHDGQDEERSGWFANLFCHGCIALHYLSCNCSEIANIRHAVVPKVSMSLMIAYLTRPKKIRLNMQRWMWKWFNLSCVISLLDLYHGRPTGTQEGWAVVDLRVGAKVVNFKRDQYISLTSSPWTLPYGLPNGVLEWTAK